MRLRAFAVLALAALAAQAFAESPWDYQGKRGPLAWGKLDPAYRACAQGHQQAPIDIRGARLNKALAPLEFHYMAAAPTLENNGRTLVLHPRPGSYIVANGKRYDLIQLDFHRPSEIAVKGKLTEMDVELLHKSADGAMAIVAIRLAETLDRPNAVLAALWTRQPAAGSSVQLTELVNPAGLLPPDRGYWSFDGSLTTPPCTEGVRWFVLEQELGVSRDQWRRFAAQFPINSRPLQDPHGRHVEASQ